MGSSYKGSNGSIHVDDNEVTFTREGLAARKAFGKDAPPRTVLLAEITGVVHKPAGKVANGHVQLLRNNQSVPAALPAEDPEGIRYPLAKTAEFGSLADWLQGVARKNNESAALLAAQASAANGSTRMQSDANGNQPWFQKRAAQLVGVGLLGLVLGSCTGGDSDAELAVLRDEQSSTEARLADAQERADGAEQEAAQLRQQITSLETAASASPAPPAPTPEPPPIDDAPPEEPEVPDAPEPAEPEPASVSYANCSEVRAAGAAPIRRGEPGYSSKLDRDGDGIACET